MVESEPKTNEDETEEEVLDGPICGGCKQPCNPIAMDFGIGSYEFWGARGYDTNVQTVSNCCEQTVYEDSTLTQEYSPEEYFNEPDYDDYNYDAEW